ncbi:hypothetical protein N9487_04235 [Cyclobacteriaceae bacterium]|nr:hypothetical protein [Cyclobacteriaceae bacterium]
MELDKPMVILIIKLIIQLNYVITGHIEHKPIQEDKQSGKTIKRDEGNITIGRRNAKVNPIEFINLESLAKA